MEQLNFDNKTKTELAIEFIQKHEPPEGYFMGDSGGKDSTVLRDLVIKSGVKFEAYYSATGIDPPELVKFIREYHPETIHRRPKYSFFVGISDKKQQPTMWRRWCCDVLKKDPTKNIPLKHRLMGIRAEESWKRANRSNPDYFKRLKQWIYKPIFHWLEWEIWEYIESHKLPYCSLYDEGFSRLGCVVCPFLCQPNQKAINKHKERWPKQYRAFEKAMKKLWDWKFCVYNKRSGAYNYFCRENNFEEFLANWYRGK